MDVDICRWILEFILRCSSNDPVLKKVIASIHVSNDDSRLKKTALLRTIESEILEASVSESILETLEMIEQLDKSEGISVMESMKAAYCAVAVECAVKYLVVDVDRNGKFFDAVQKIWRGRVDDLERSGKSELVSRELKGWMEELEAALWNKDVRENLITMNTRNFALKLVLEYLGEAWAIVGPPFIQLSAILTDHKMMKHIQSVQSESNLASKEFGEGGVGASDVGKNIYVSDGTELPAQTMNQAEVEAEAEGSADKQTTSETGTRAVVSLNIFQDTIVNDKLALADEGVKQAEEQELAAEIVNQTDADASNDKGDPKTCDVPRNRCKHLSPHRRTRGRAKITDHEDLENGASSSQYNSILTPDVTKVQEALKSSSLELQAVVKDPLPDALRLSDAIISDVKNTNQESSFENRSGVDVHSADPSVMKSNKPVKTNTIEHGNLCSSHKNVLQPSLNNVLRPSLMERNSSSHTYEWDDSIDDGLPVVNRTGRLHLPSPKRKAVSPLKKYEIAKFVRRRKIKRWSVLEEDTLRTAVQKYGKGNWKLILKSYDDVFEERTEVDLKDKWRNMTRY